MDSTKLVTKHSFKLDLDKINSEIEPKNNTEYNNSLRKSKLYPVFDYQKEYSKNNIKETLSLSEQLKLIEEENIRLREINEQLSRSLTLTTRSISASAYNSLEQTSDLNKYLSYNEDLLLTSRTININSNLVKNIKATVSDIIGDRSEIALGVTILEEEYFLGLEPIFNSQSARVVLLKTPSYWSIKKIPQFWEGFSNIMSSVIQKGLLNTLSYWSFLRAPPTPKRNVKKWEGITLKYKGPLKEYRGYSLAGNDDGLFVYLQSEEDAYDNIFYCNFRKKRERFDQNNENVFRNVKNILNLLHANTRSYICINSKEKSSSNSISVKLSDSKRNKLMFEEIGAAELLTKQLLESTEQLSHEIDTINREVFHSETTSFKYNEQDAQKGIYTNNRSVDGTFTSRTVEPCLSIQRVSQFKNNSLAEELFFEVQNSKNTNNCAELGIAKISDSRIFKTEENLVSESKMCSPRIKASKFVNDQVSEMGYHEVPLTKRLNIVYMPSTTAVLVHDLVDSEDGSNNCTSDHEKVSDAEQEYFKIN